MDYKIILPLKIRELTIAKAYRYIEAIQSYPGNWPLIIITGNIEGLSWDQLLEGITPLPTTYGALCFPELYLDDELLIAILRERLSEEVVSGIIKAINRGEEIHRLVPYSLLKDIEQRIPEILAGVDFEAFIPLRKEVKKLDEITKNIDIIDDIKLFKVGAFPVEPKTIERDLDRAYHVGEYLADLERTFNEVEEEELDILRVGGFVKAGMKLTDLEEELQCLLDRIPARRLTLMFTRVIL
ncbi:MAG: hypothetical protein DRZ82_09535 [Thermoprotei archaeon]|nr:MAG: hypothetical protein DRZ82_09535 [Thermoprotei archaeon]